MIEKVFEKRKNDFRFVKEKGIILVLEIFMLVLFPNLIGIISLKAATTFVTYENTQINCTATILAKKILTLNHCRRVVVHVVD